MDNKKTISQEEVTRLVNIASEMKHHGDCKIVLDYLIELLVFDKEGEDD